MVALGSMTHTGLYISSTTYIGLLLYKREINFYPYVGGEEGWGFCSSLVANPDNVFSLKVIINLTSEQGRLFSAVIVCLLFCFFVSLGFWGFGGVFLGRTARHAGP